MSFLSDLSDEIAGDPLTRNYAGLSDAALAARLNTVDRSRVRAEMTGDQVFQQTDDTQFAALTDAKRADWLAFCARDRIDPGAAANVAFVQWVFGGGATVTALNSARMEPCSRAAELGLGRVRPFDVARARA